MPVGGQRDRPLYRAARICSKSRPKSAKSLSAYALWYMEGRGTPPLREYLGPAPTISKSGRNSSDPRSGHGVCIADAPHRALLAPAASRPLARPKRGGRSEKSGRGRSKETLIKWALLLLLLPLLPIFVFLCEKGIDTSFLIYKRSWEVRSGRSEHAPSAPAPGKARVGERCATRTHQLATFFSTKFRPSASCFASWPCELRCSRRHSECSPTLPIPSHQPGRE